MHDKWKIIMIISVCSRTTVRHMHDFWHTCWRVYIVGEDEAHAQRKAFCSISFVAPSFIFFFLQPNGSVRKNGIGFCILSFRHLYERQQLETWPSPVGWMHRYRLMREFLLTTHIHFAFALFSMWMSTAYFMLHVSLVVIVVIPSLCCSSWLDRICRNMQPKFIIEASSNELRIATCTVHSFFVIVTAW